MKHDDNCGGCATERRFQEANGSPIAVTDALGHCQQCSYSMNSVYIHKVDGKRLCSTCADAEAMVIVKASAMEAFREASGATKAEGR